MAITQVGSTTTAQAASPTSSTINKPTGTLQGHVMVLLLTTNDDSVTTLSGWTQIMSATDSTNHFSDHWYYKVAGGSEPSSYNWSTTGNAPVVISLMTFSGVDNSAPIGDHSDNTSNGTTATVNSPDFTDTIGAGIPLYSRSVRRSSASGPWSITSATSGQSSLANHGISSGGSVSYSHGIFISNTEFSGASHSPAHIAIASSGTPAGNVNSAFTLKSAGVEVDLGAGSVAAASTTANDATVLIQTVQAATSSTAAYDASVDQKPNAAAAGVTAAAYDGLRPAFASVGNVDTQAYSTSLHLDVNADVAEVAAGVVNAIAYYGASKVRMFQVPPENRTFMVRR